MKEQLLPSLWLIGLSIVMSVMGQTAMKFGVSQGGSAGLELVNPLSLVTFIARSPMVILGLALYGIGAGAWIVVLSRLDLSYAYPFVALNFVLVALVSRLVFAESIPVLRWLGIGFICVGILLIARSPGGG